MSYVVTLVASNEKEYPVTSQDAQKITALLQELGYQVTSSPSWIEQGKAVDIGIENFLNVEDLPAIRQSLKATYTDIFCNSIDHRRKKLLCADMDSTIVVGETLDDLAGEIGLKEQIAEITERAMNGEMPFDQALRERIRLLKDLPAEKMRTTLEKLRLNKGAKAFINVMRDHGAICVLVTGGFTFFAEPVAKECNFHECHGNMLKIEDGVLTGYVQEPILDKNSKLQLLKEYTYKNHIKPTQTMAIGDGANDLPMLEHASFGVGYHPKKLVQEKLVNVIMYGDLTAALYAQGYNSSHIRKYL